MPQSAGSPVPFGRAPRSLADKLQELALRSPKDVQALIVLVDLILSRLNATG